MSREKLYLWALLRITRGDSTGDSALDTAGYGVMSSAEHDPREIAEAAIRGDEAVVTAQLPSGMTRDMILG